MPSSVSAIIGLMAGGLLSALAIRSLAGTPEPLVWHAMIAVLGLMALGLGWRHTARWLILPAALTVLAFLALSFLAVPGLVRSGALEIADGQPFCILGAEVSAELDGSWRRPYILSPALAEAQELTLLAPQHLELVVQLPAPADPAPYEQPDPVFALYTWGGLWTGFTKTMDLDLSRGRLSVLLGCEPKVDPFRSVDASLPSALLIMRDRFADAEGKGAWGPRRYERYRIPAEAEPVHDGLFGPAELGFTAALLPGAEPVFVMVSYPEDAGEWMNDQLRHHVRDADAPLDFATLPINDLGLAAYVVPSTSVADAIVGTYAAFGTDGLPVTAIACDEYECLHHMRAYETGHRVLTLHYPPALLPLWRAFEAAATAQVTGFLISGE